MLGYAVSSACNHEHPLKASRTESQTGNLQGFVDWLLCRNDEFIAMEGLSLLLASFD